MRDRLVTAAGAVIACLIVYALFAQPGAEVPVTRPLSNEAGRNGYAALAEWLARHDVPVVSWRERFDSLAAGGGALAPRGNIMLTTMPHRYAIRDTERQQLLGWIRRGNTLLILAALNDSPEWLEATSTFTFLDELGQLTRMSFEEAVVDTPDVQDLSLSGAVAPGTRVALEPLEHPLTDGVAELAAVSDDVSSLWTASRTSVESDGIVLRLARESSYDLDALWQLPFGDGQVLLVSTGSLLSNDQIDESDAGRFVANIVHHHLGPQGAFVFDDMHQGLTSLYDPAAFYADDRLHATIGFLIVGWLAYLLGSSNRLAPVRAARHGPSQRDLLAGVGGFLARRLDRREAGLLLLEEWFGELRRDRGLGEGSEPPWQALEATPTLSPKTLEWLRDVRDRLARGQAIDLVQLHNVLRQARRAIG